MSLNRPQVKIPSSPEFAEVSIWPCTVVEGRQEAKFVKFYHADSFGQTVEFCITEEHLQNLLKNIEKIAIYNQELVEIIKGLADIVEEEKVE